MTDTNRTLAGVRWIGAGMLGAAALTGCASNIATVTDLRPRSEQRLVFSDEFSGDSLGDAWSTCYWWQVDGGCTIASNDEQQWYRPEAVEVADGVVTLSASADEQHTTDGEVLPFRSGLITTGPVDNDTDHSGFAFTFGRVEARVRFPQGAGTWPAVWLLSADRTSLPEIDIMEWYGSEPDVVSSRVHQRVNDERASARIDHTAADVAGGWHEVGVEWSSHQVEFFFDGESIGVVDDPDLVPSTPMYLIANLALGGAAGTVDVDALPQTFAIDWIRVWQ